MGGFMLNGCGTADSYYKLKDLPHLKCGGCKNKTLALMELRRKIRVIYIPTLTLNTKYAVVCPSCKNGYYVSTEQKDYILNNPAECVEMTAEGVVIHGIGTRRPEIQPEQQEQSQRWEAPVVKEEPQNFSTNPAAQCACGAELQPGDIFCAYCGARVQSTGQPEFVENVQEPPVEKIEKKEFVIDIPSDNFKKSATGNASKSFVLPNVRHRKVCPSCRMMFAPEKEICAICGSQLVDKR